MKKTFAFYLVGLLFTVGISISVNAQAPGPPDPVNVPVDGGISAFLALGAAFAAKKIYDGVKGQKSDTE